MLHYGNMFRVADCPANGYQNRVASVDLRHLIKDRAVHADMVMWAPDDAPEDAAEQLLCTAFSVPQISMLLADLPDDHTAMLRRYLSWWVDHRDVLLSGQVRAPRPDLGYPVVTSVLGDESVAVGYSPGAVVPVLPVPLVATVLLRDEARALSELELKAEVQALMDGVEVAGGHVYVPRTDRDYALTVGLRMLALRGLVHEHDGLFQANPAELTILRYYANSIAHLVV